VEDVDAVLAVDGDRGDVGQRPAVGQLRKIVDDAVAVLAGAENGRHLFFLFFVSAARSSLHCHCERSEAVQTVFAERSWIASLRSQ